MARNIKVINLEVVSEVVTKSAVLLALSIFWWQEKLHCGLNPQLFPSESPLLLGHLALFNIDEKAM